jgi:metallopeptidase family M12-like protein
MAHEAPIQQSIRGVKEVKLLAAAAAALITCLSVSSPTSAAMPAPVYVKKAVFIRIHYDATFYNFWRGRTTNVDTMVEGWFNAVRDIYKNTPSMHNVDLYLLNDFTRANSRIMSYNDSTSHLTANVRPGEIGGNKRLVNYMHSNLATGPVSRTIGGKTHAVGRTVNWVFVHRGEGGLQGEVDAISALGSADANLFVTTAVGDVTALNGQYFPLQAEPFPYAEIIDTIVHETGHIIGARHDLATGCPTKAPYTGGEIMCGSLKRGRFFGSANYNAATTPVKIGLNRCNNAFSSQGACENAVDQECGRILDYTQIAACQAEMKLTYCSDLCTLSLRQARVVINALPTTIGSGVVSAPAF